MVETKVYILKDFTFGVPGYLWNELPGLVDALMKPDTIIIKNHWGQVSSGCPRTRQQDAGEETSPLP
jgi:hypothetical protein